MVYNTWANVTALDSDVSHMIHRARHCSLGDAIYKMSPWGNRRRVSLIHRLGLNEIKNHLHFAVDDSTKHTANSFSLRCF
jgi:hypothetical protein